MDTVTHCIRITLWPLAVSGDPSLYCFGGKRREEPHILSFCGFCAARALAVARPGTLHTTQLGAEDEQLQRAVRTRRAILV